MQIATAGKKKEIALKIFFAYDILVDVFSEYSWDI